MKPGERVAIVAMTVVLIVAALVSIWTYDWRWIVSAGVVAVLVPFAAVVLETPSKAKR